MKHPNVHVLLQEVLMTALHRLSNEPEVADLWKSTVAFALAHSGLCSKNTTLGISSVVGVFALTLTSRHGP
jgi:hypothetical protein